MGEGEKQSEHVKSSFSSSYPKDSAVGVLEEQKLLVREFANAHTHARTHVRACDHLCSYASLTHNQQPGLCRAGTGPGQVGNVGLPHFKLYFPSTFVINAVYDVCVGKYMYM